MTPKTCKKGIHPYAPGKCRQCVNDYSRELMRKRRRAAGIPERVFVPGRDAAESNRSAGRKWRIAHPAEHKAMQRAVVEKAGLGYAAHAMGMRVADVPVDVLEAKSALILLNRKLRGKENG